MLQVISDDNFIQFDYFILPVAGGLALALLLILIFSIHDRVGITTGTVINKSHYSNELVVDTYVTLMPLNIIYVPNLIKSDLREEAWSVTIRKGKKTNDFNVTESEYRNIEEGDLLVFKNKKLVSIT